MNLSQLITEYETSINFKNVQALRCYESKKQALLEFIKPTTNIKKITSKTCGEYIKFLTSKGNSTATIQAKYSLLHNYLKYAYNNNYLEFIPFIKLPKNHTKERKIIDKKSTLRMLYCCKQKGFNELRKIILIAYYTGLRISNIIDLQPYNIDKNYLRIWENKTDNPYSIPIKNRLKVLLNKNFKPFSLNYQSLYYQFNIIKKELNLDKNITIHSFRHTFCSRCIEKGIDLRIVQELAGHKSIQTTIKYTHIKDKQKEIAIALL